MICEPCRKRDHDACPGPGWCNCKHRPNMDPQDVPLAVVE